MRYKLTLQYDGGGYHGWQKQKSQPLTVQQTIEEAIAKVTGSPVKLEGSGRTDEGVHALGQAAHFDTDKELPAERYLAAINYYLPEDIRITRCEEVSQSFHARKSVKRKTYIYVMYVSQIENPLLRARAHRIAAADAGKMDAAAKELIGRHDFSAFMSSGSSAKTFVRTVFDAGVTEKDGFIIFSITGDGFLYNMVRIITGILIRIGKGEAADIRAILLKRDRRLAPDIAPAHGLYLYNVEY